MSKSRSVQEIYGAALERAPRRAGRRARRDCVADGGGPELIEKEVHLPEIFGFLPPEGTSDPREIWIQSRDPGYREVPLADLRGQTDLNELAPDAGTQLAGHFWTTSRSRCGGTGDSRNCAHSG